MPKFSQQIDSLLDNAGFIKLIGAVDSEKMDIHINNLNLAKIALHQAAEAFKEGNTAKANINLKGVVFYLELAKAIIN